MPDPSESPARPPLSPRACAFIHVTFAAWLLLTLYEILFPTLQYLAPFIPWPETPARLRLGYVIFAAAALCWTWFVIDAGERRRARVLTTLLLLIMASMRFAWPPLAAVLTSGAATAGPACEKLNGVLAAGVVCMWFGATGLTIALDSIGRLPSPVDDGDDADAPRPRAGYWLLAAYVIIFAYQAFSLYIGTLPAAIRP